MGSDIQVYKNDTFGSIRVFEEDGDIWFVAIDVARALGYASTKDMLRSLYEDEKGYSTLSTPGGEQRATTINEPGFYHALNMRRTACMKDPEARARVEGFQRWVNHEVLPSIRRNGAYINPAGAETPEELMARAVKAADAILAAREQRIKELETENAAMQPKAAFADAVADTQDGILVRTMATILTQNGYPIGEKRFYGQLREDGFIQKQKGKAWNTPTQKSMSLGLMVVREFVIRTPFGGIARQTAYITGKGQQYFLRKYAGIGKQRERYPSLPPSPEVSA